MNFEADRGNDEPSITDMVQKALAILKRAPKGFILMVEGKYIYEYELHLRI